MIFRIRKWLQRIEASGQYHVLFIPLKAQTACDPVKVIFNSLRTLAAVPAEYIVVETKPSHILDVVPDLGRKDGSQRIVIFGHASHMFGYNGFAVNSKALKQQDVLPVTWWERPNGRFKMTLAHVGYGGRILANPAWRSTFPAWVSYERDVHALLLTNRDQQIWADIAKSTIEAARQSQTAHDLKNRIRAIYELKMSEVLDSGDPSRIVHAMHFQNAIEGLISSDDL